MSCAWHVFQRGYLAPLIMSKIFLDVSPEHRAGIRMAPYNVA